MLVNFYKHYSIFQRRVDRMRVLLLDSCYLSLRAYRSQTPDTQLECLRNEAQVQEKAPAYIHKWTIGGLLVINYSWNTLFYDAF